MKIDSSALTAAHPSDDPEAKEVATAAARELYEARSDQTARNDVIQRRLMIIDQAYQNYVTGLRQEKTRSDFITGISAIALGLAGTLTSSAGVKTNYAAAGTLLAGGTVLANKTLYYEKTVMALAAAMDASRAEIRLKIYTSMRSGTSEYTAADAYEDLLAYERAGTLISAIGYVQDSATKSLAATQEHIQSIAKLTPDQYQYKTCNSRSLFSDNAQWTNARLLAAASDLKVNVPVSDQGDNEAVASLLRNSNRQASPALVTHIYEVLKSNDLMIPCP